MCFSTIFNPNSFFSQCEGNDFEADRCCLCFIWCSPPQRNQPSSLDDMHPTRATTVSPRRPSQVCAAGGCGQFGNSLCIQKFCKTCCVNTATHCPVLRHNYRAPVEHSPIGLPGALYKYSNHLFTHVYIIALQNSVERGLNMQQQVHETPLPGMFKSFP